MIGAAITSLLAADGTIAGLVGTRIQRGRIAEALAAPYVLFELSGLTPEDTSDATRSARLTVEAYATGFAAADAIRDAAEDALIGEKGVTSGTTIYDVVRTDGDEDYAEALDASDAGHEMSRTQLLVFYSD